MDYEEKQLKKVPCYECLVRPACMHRRILRCDKLARYIQPKYEALRVRIERARKLVPRVDHVQGNGWWADIPADMFRFWPPQIPGEKA